MMRRVPLLIVTLVGGLLLMLLPRPSVTPTAAVADAAERPRYSARGVSWTRLDADGATEFVARIENLDIYDDESAQLRQLELRDVGGIDSPWRLRAPRGHAPAGTRTLILQGAVQGEGRWPDGEALRLETMELAVDPVAETFSGDAQVTLSSLSRNARADGLRALADGRQLRLLGNVRIDYASP